MAIYFLSPDYAFPSGGVRVIYRHVDILNAHGIEAYVLHRKHGFRCEWFENNTPIVYLDSTYKRRAYFKIRERFKPDRPREWFLRNARANQIGPEDILVLPEINGPEMANMALGVPKVILNQGCYLTFQGYPLDQDQLMTPYGHPEFKAVLTNSIDGLQYLKYVFSNIQAGHFRPSIDPNLFQYQRNKKKQICFTTRKNQLLFRQIINILKFRGALRDFELVSFDGITQPEVAKIFQNAAIYLSFATYEGFGLPPAEAMACGCVVIGFDAGGGKEFFLPEFSYPVDYGDVIGFARMVEQVIKEYSVDPAPLLARGKAASEYIHHNYSPKREEQDVVEFWRGVLKI